MGLGLGLGLIERFNGSSKFLPRNNLIYIIKKQLFACLFTEFLEVVIIQLCWRIMDSGVFTKNAIIA